jgi:hypothetical protein
MMRKAFPGFEKCFGFFAVFRVDAHHPEASGMRSEFRVGRKLVCGRISLNECDINLVGFLRAEDFDQLYEHGLGFGQQNDAAGFEIETMGIGEIG